VHAAENLQIRFLITSTTPSTNSMIDLHLKRSAANPAITVSPLAAALLLMNFTPNGSGRDPL
jgi:hypothetical protein